MSNIILKEHYFDYSSFIGGWYMPNFICDDLINFFKTHSEYTEKGKSFYENRVDVHSHIKDSIDFSIPHKAQDYPFFLYRIYLKQCLDNYTEKYKNVKEDLYYFDINTNYNIQYYPPNGGFKTWHSERMGPNVSKRVLVFMTYLNDVKDGGTDFYYQNLTSPAKKGLTLIWPSEWTHMHKGQISKTNEKYIVTGWYTFNEC